MAKLLTIDGLGIVRRVYEANKDPDTPDKAELALRHALSSFRRLLLTHQPSHVLPAFDFGGHTWRHALYAPYRAGREPIPSVLQERLPDFHQKLAGLGLHFVSLPEVEAEDVIATAILRWLDENRGEAIIASTDRALHVLIAHGAMVWDHFKNEWHDRAWVEKKFGVPPETLADLLALMGDASDNIPGVSKVGIKTAAKLLRGYGNLDAVMAGAGILKGTLGETLRRERDLINLSRQLVALKTDVRMGLTWRMLGFDATQLS